MTPRSLSADQLRHYAVARTLFGPLPLAETIERLGFLQADPIRAPARAQDLILRQRVAGYRAGDLERAYASLEIEEDFFINYGFLPRGHHQLMRPRPTRGIWDARNRRRIRDLLAFVGERGLVHPRDAEAQFAGGRVTNYWGGTSNATTHLLDAMHYRGLLRIARRERGIRVYVPAAVVSTNGASRLQPAVVRARLDALIDLLVRLYGPIPQESLIPTTRKLRYAVPQWQTLLPAAVTRARRRLPSFSAEGVTYYYAEGEDPWSDTHTPEATVRLLAPFDPLVWDRRRFERLWGWAYRFEAYTPVAKRQRGYYALPLLYRDRVVGWANVTVEQGTVRCEPGFIEPFRRNRTFNRELDAEIERLRQFLGRDEPEERGVES